MIATIAQVLLRRPGDVAAAGGQVLPGAGGIGGGANAGGGVGGGPSASGGGEGGGKPGSGLGLIGIVFNR